MVIARIGKERYQIQGWSFLGEFNKERKMKRIISLAGLGLLWGVSALAIESVPFDGGVFGGEGVVMGGNGFTDSYDSEKGAYGDTNIASHGNIGSNMDIHLYGNALVNGNAIPGPAHRVILTENARVTGKTDPALKKIKLDLLQGFKIGTKDLEVRGSEEESLEAGIHHYRRVLVTGKLFLKGKATLYCSSFNLSGRGEVHIEKEAEIYCLEDFQVSGQGVFNAGGEETGDATNATVYIKGGESLLPETKTGVSGRGKFFGVLYAPEREALISGNGEVFGAVTGKGVSVEGNGKVHFDEALIKVRLIWERTFEGYVGGFGIGKREDGEAYLKFVTLRDTRPLYGNEAEDIASDPFFYGMFTTTVLFFDEDMEIKKRLDLPQYSKSWVSEDGRFIIVNEVLETLGRGEVWKRRERESLYDADGNVLESEEYVNEAEEETDYILFSKDGKSRLYGGSDFFIVYSPDTSFIMTSAGELGSAFDVAILDDYLWTNQRMTPRNFYYIVKKYDLKGNLIWASEPLDLSTGEQSTSGTIGNIVLSPDGFLLATIVSVSKIRANRVVLLDVATGALRWRSEPLKWEGFTRLHFSGNERIIAITSENIIYSFNIMDGKLEWTYSNPQKNLWFESISIPKENTSKILVGAVTDEEPSFTPWWGLLFNANGRLLWKKEILGSSGRFEWLKVKFANDEGTRFFITNSEKVYYYKARR